MWAIAAQQATSAEAAIRCVALASQGGSGGGGGELAVVRRSVKFSGSSKPIVQRLSKEELPRLLPWSGCGERLMTEVGDLEACVARVALSLVACSLVYNNSIELASLAGFYWAWAPILSTALPNLLLRLRYRYAGIWNAQVLQVNVTTPPKILRDDSGDLLGKLFNRLPSIPSTLQLEIGDGSPATFRMEIRFADDVPEVKAGDRVNVMVVSDEPSFSRFKALRDVYLPDRRAWLSEKPCIEREPFEKMQRIRSPPLQTYGSKRGNGRRTQLLLEENTSTGDREPWARAVRRDYAVDDQGQRKGLDYVDSFSDRKTKRRPNELDNGDSTLEKKDGRPTKGLEYDDLYL